MRNERHLWPAASARPVVAAAGHAGRSAELVSCSFSSATYSGNVRDWCADSSQACTAPCGSGAGMAAETPLSDVRFLTVSEVATIMRVSKMTVYRLVHSGELEAIRVGRSFRVPEAAVNQYLRDAFVGTG